MASCARLSRYFLRFNTKSQYLRVCNRTLSLNSTIWNRLPYESACALSQGLYRRSCHAQRDTGRQTQMSILDQKLALLDNQSRKWGRVDADIVETVLDLLKKDENITDQQALMVIRSTGKMLAKLSASERNSLYEKLWKTLHRTGSSMNIAHYNAALRVRLENEEASLNPADYLAVVERQGFAPNRVTYQLLIASYCEKGDIEGASQILEFMKVQNMPINETVFNALVKGHFRNRDEEGALAVLESMRSAGLEPTADTYKVAMCSYAELGDIASINKTLSDAEKDEVIIQPRHLYAVLHSIAKYNYGQHIDEIIELVKRRGTRYNFDGINCMYALIADGHIDAAFKVCVSLERQDDNHKPDINANSFLRQLIVTDKPVKEVFKYQQLLHQAGLLENDLSVIGLMALRLKKSADYTLDIFSQMKLKGHELKLHYFWPVFLNLAMSNEREGIYKVIRAMYTDNLVKGNIVTTIFNHGVTSLLKSGEGVPDIATRLEEFGIPKKDIRQIVISCHLFNGNICEALDCLNKTVQAPPGIVKSTLPDCYVSTGRNGASIAEFLKKSATVAGKGMVAINSGVVLGILKRAKLNNEEMDALVEEFISKDLPIHTHFGPPISQVLKDGGVSDITLQNFEKLLTDESTFPMVPELTIEELRSMSVTVLEKKQKDFIEAKRSTIKVDKWLLSKYCATGNIKGVDKIKARLDDSGFIYRPDILKQLSIYSAKYKKNASEALEYLEKIEKTDPNYTTYGAALLRIATLQLQNGNAKEALKTLKSHQVKHGDSLKRSELSSSLQLGHLCNELLEAAVEKSTPTVVKELAETLFHVGYIKEGVFSVLQHIMDSHIRADDHDGMVECLEYCVTKYGVAPRYSVIFRTLINAEHPERLQKVVDLMSTKQGEMDVLFRLVFAFIDCDKIKQARKILQTPGLRAIMPVIQDGCNHYIKNNKVDQLRQFVEITKDLFGIDRDEVLFSLIRAYLKVKSYKEATDVLSIYEEEGINPRPRTLRYLAKALSANNVPVPFTVPASVKNVSGFTRPANETEKEAIAALKDESYDHMFDVIERNINNQELSDQFFAECGFVLNKAGETEKLKKLVRTLSSVGAASAINPIVRLPLKGSIKSYVMKQHFLALLNSTNISDTVETAMADISKFAENISEKSLATIADMDPGIFAKVEDLITSSSSDGAPLKLVMMLFNYHLLNGDISKAKGLAEDYPAIRDQLKVVGVCNRARIQNKEIALQTIIHSIRGSSNRRLAIPYNQAILLKCQENDWEGALEYLKKAQEDSLSLDDLGKKALLILESLLVANSQPLPWQAGSIADRGNYFGKQESSLTDKVGIQENV